MRRRSSSRTVNATLPIPRSRATGRRTSRTPKGISSWRRGKTYRAEKDGELLPGPYTVLASSDASHAFKVRVGGYVRNFTHGDVLVLKDGEEICAVSGAVILR